MISMDGYLDEEEAVFNKVQHVGYLVPDVDAAVAWYERTFSAKYTGGGSAPIGTLGFVQIGDVEVELIEPSDKSGLASGQHTFHHVGYVVDNLDEAVANFKAKGYKFATPEPRINIMGYRIIFFDTSSTEGTRIHLTEASSLEGKRTGPETGP